jgi:hypothetical protein
MDVFFQSEYGKLYEKSEKGKCETFEYKAETGIVRNMYIKRPVPQLVDGVQYYDVTTPYGYGGPIVVEGVPSSELIAGYYRTWAKHCREEKIVAEFIRFHLFDNTELRVAFPGEVLYISENVVRCLDKSMDAIWMEFEHKVRKNVKKAKDNGLNVTIDATGEHLNEFLDIYYKTMVRNEAKDFYYFDREYYQAIINTLFGQYMFFHVWHGDVVVSTELVLYSDRYVYSFLGGTLDEYYPMRPNDLLKYEIIRWSKETGHQAFILSGGYGKNDGIYRYKKAFAPNNDVPFYVGRKVWNQDLYNRLVEIRKMDVGKALNVEYFPLYRG